MSATGVQPVRRRRMWCLALLLAVVGALFVGPQAGPARADDCDKIKGPLKEFCQRDGGDEKEKEQPKDKDKPPAKDKEKPKEEEEEEDPCPAGPAGEFCQRPGDTQKPKDPLDDDPAGLSPSCKNAPSPALPGRGSSSWAVTPPKKAPAPIDPGTAGARAHLFEQYGLSGLQWHTYDLDCMGVDGIVSSTGASYETKLANWLFDVSKWWTGLATGLQQQATGDGYLTKLNGIFGDATRAVAKAVYQPWIAISLLVLGLGIVYRARARNMPDIVKGLAWALLVLTVTSLAFNYPEKAGNMADTAITKTVGEIQQNVAGEDARGATAGTSQGNLLTSAILYQGWAEGVFGDSDGKTAKKYGMKLFDAQSLTWAESRLPGKERTAVINAKSKKWEELAAKIKSEDPDAYRHLTGAADGRLGTAFNTAIGAIPSNFYAFATSIVICCARLIIKMIIVFLPAIAPIALHRQLGGTLRTLGKSGAAAVINAPLFALAAAIDTLLIQVLLKDDSQIPNWFAIVLIWIITIMLWAISKPFRKLNAMVSPNSEWFSAGTGVLGKGKAAVAGAVLGYAKGRMNARQIGRMINGKGGKGGRGAEDSGEAMSGTDGEVTQHSTRRSGEPWSDEVPYEPGAAPQTRDDGYWGASREDGDVPWVSEPHESAGDDTPQQPTYVPAGGRSETDGHEGQHTAEEAGTSVEVAPYTAPSSTTPATPPLTRPTAADWEEAAQVNPHRPAPPPASLPTQTTARPESTSPSAAPAAHEGDRPVPMAPQVTDADGNTTFVIYSPGNGYSAHRTDADPGRVVTPEEDTDA